MIIFHMVKWKIREGLGMSKGDSSRQFTDDFLRFHPIMASSPPSGSLDQKIFKFAISICHQSFRLLLFNLASVQQNVFFF